MEVSTAIMDEEKVIYRLDDNISFRKCTLFNKEWGSHGDCTNFFQTERNWQIYYGCNQDGLHFHCTKHPEIELERKQEYGQISYLCPKCMKPIQIKDEQELKNKCLRMLNIPEFKNARLIRLDDWYIPEVKEKVKTDSNYWVKTEIKTDRNDDTVIVIYVGCQGVDGKVQYFVKPEKLQLNSDHKDLDPATIISRIQVTLKDRELIHEYNE